MQPTLTHLPPGMVSNSLVNWWQKKRRFFTRPNAVRGRVRSAHHPGRVPRAPRLVRGRAARETTAHLVQLAFTVRLRRGNSLLREQGPQTSHAFRALRRGLRVRWQEIRWQPMGAMLW